MLFTNREIRHVLRDFTASVEEYANAAPEGKSLNLSEKFGEPKEIAKSFIENTDVKTLKKRLVIRRIIIGIALAAALAVTAFTVYVAIDNHITNQGAFIYTGPFDPENPPDIIIVHDNDEWTAYTQESDN